MFIISTIGRHLAGNAIGYLALVVATSGTAYAAATIGSPEVIDGSLRSVDISDETTLNGGLSGIDIRTNTLTGADIQEGTLAKVPNADMLDGLDSGAFVQGRGQVYSGAAAIAAGNGFAQIFLSTSDPAFFVAYNCPADLSGNGVLRLQNDSADLANVFSDNGSSNPGYTQLAGGGAVWDQFAAATGEHITFQLQTGGGRMVEFDVHTVHRPASGDCHVQATATVYR